MDKNWTLEIEAKKHQVGLDFPVDFMASDTGIVKQAKDGKLVVDGIMVDTWKTESSLPKQINFEIAGKPAILRKKGLFSSGLDLFVEAKLIKPA